MFKVNNKDARRLYCYLSTYFTRFSGVSIVNFEHAILPIHTVRYGAY